MKTRSRSKRQGTGWSRVTLLGCCVMGAALPVTGAEAPTEAKEDPKPAPKEEAKAEETAKEMTPEEIFEGGTNTYNNWLELGFGGFVTKGNKAQAQQRHGLPDGAFGGIQDFHFQSEIATNTTFTADGRALFDNNDYKLKLAVVRPDTGYVRFDFEQFRTWYNGDGGYYRPANAWYPLSGDALSIDRGKISFEAGLTLENQPQLNFRYTHEYRDGNKGSTSWGQTHPSFTSLVRGVSPSFYDIDERRDIFELNATHRIKTTDVGLGVRYENGDLDNSRKITQWPNEASLERKITNHESTSYDMFSAHFYTETWLKTNLLFSTGYLFSDYDSDLSGSRVYGNDFDVGYVPNAANGVGYYDLHGSLNKQEHVVNLNLMATPFTHLSIVPSVRVLSESWDGDSSAMQTLGTSAPFLASSRTEGDALDVQERLDIRYTGVTNWVLYARGEWDQGTGSLSENGGLGQTTPIRRKTDNERDFQKYSAGVRWYPARTVNVDFGGYYKRNAYDYDHHADSTSNSGASGNRYPAYLVTQDFETYDGSVRLTLRPTQKVTLVSRYEYQESTIHTKPDGASGLTEVEASDMTSHIVGQNVSWSPWTRLYLQAGVNYVWSETRTPASKSTQAILDAQNNYWTVNLNSGLVVDQKTDLNIGYFYYESDNFQNNSVAGLPLGSSAREHSVSATIVRRLSERLRLTLRYGYSHYDDVTYGGHNSDEAHLVYTAMQYRF